MANTRQAKKRIKQAEKHRCNNAARKSEMRTYIKDVVKAIEAGNREKASAVYQIAVSMLDRLANKNVITKNKAARNKTRLNSRIKAIADSLVVKNAI